MGKKTSKKLDALASLTGSILESISDGVFTVDLNWKITSFNRAAEAITGIKRAEAIGKRCGDVFRSSMCEANCALKKTLINKRPAINISCFIVRADGKRIPVSVSTAVLYDEQGEIIGGAETFRDLSELEALRKELDGRYRVGDLISRSHTMRKVFDLVPAVSSTHTTVLIQGETGTGKELVARAIHGSGKFATRPFVAVNCGALPDSLLESELFGYKKGAFTGAYADKPGWFSMAKDGTILLDEIGEISSAMQVKLLRVLQERSFEPLGGTVTLSLKARIVASTNRDLAEMVKQGAFREDLFYRINVIRIDLPPLRQRKEDIPLLLMTFIEKFNHIYKKNMTGISNEALSMLMSHNWPGNIRELENLIERSFILCPGETIGLDCLPEHFHSDDSKQATGMVAARKSVEAQSIRNALINCDFNCNKTAKELGVHRATLYRKIKSLKIELPTKTSK